MDCYALDELVDLVVTLILVRFSKERKVTIVGVGCVGNREGTLFRWSEQDNEEPLQGLFDQC